ncbi:YbfB/YjiJ family MFS transporter [Marinobacter adhaerens]|uniref:YbfB/YjiJ family MFS transporter n=1 Tax=Marinobacter adhaerens TaxID=1033846 RepID=UPI0003067917|nr:YbfB/YjiJ family MFS transporter [Marinobacter adhaerens]
MKPIETIKVLVASVIAVVVMVGIARFSYTPMIPEMVAALGLSKSVVGMLATVNYAGYLTGAVLITRISDLGLKVRLYQLGLVVAVVSTVLMGYTTNVWLWFILRFISGLSTSAGMLLGAGLLMSWLIKNNQKSELGVFFSGIGLGIVLTAVTAELIKDPFTWDQQWVIYGLVALALLIPAWRWMPDYRACALPKRGQPLVATSAVDSYVSCNWRTSAPALAMWSRLPFWWLLLNPCPSFRGRAGWSG